MFQITAVSVSLHAVDSPVTLTHLVQHSRALICLDCSQLTIERLDGSAIFFFAYEYYALNFRLGPLGHQLS